MTKTKENLEELDTQALLYRLLADKVGAVDPQNVFFAKKMQEGKNAGKFSCLVGGKKMTAKQLTNLQQEAMMLEKTQIWQLLTATLKNEAQLRMFEKSKTTEDMFFGKALLHSIGIFETIVMAVKDSYIEETPKPFVTPKVINT